MIQTQTQIGIRTQLMIFQMHYVVEKSAKSKLLKDIIEYCIRQKLLGRVTLWGMLKNEAHANMELSIDHDHPGGRVNVTTEYPAGEFCAPPRGGKGPASDASPVSDPDLCPIWSEAIDWFMQLLEEKELWLHWTVRFRDKHDEMCKKFGLVSATHVDKTADAPSHMIPNSVVSECTLRTRFSDTVFPEGE